MLDLSNVVTPFASTQTWDTCAVNQVQPIPVSGLHQPCIVCVSLCSHILSGGCLDNDYCLVDGWCCPKEQDPQACALANGVTLPPDFVGPTTSAAGSNVTSVVASPTSGVARPTSGSTKPTSVSSGLPVFTGAASLNTVAGGSGFLYAVLVMVGNAF